ncbi:MAG: phosphoenolpyruvate--protein phosphotransferase [Planctomycetota bacterium]
MVDRSFAIQAVPVSPGIAIGKVSVHEGTPALLRAYPITAAQVDLEIERLQQALEKARQQILELRDEVAEHASERDALIFDAHVEILKDPVLVRDVKRRMEKDLVNVETVLMSWFDDYEALFKSSDHEVMKQRVGDLRDVCHRLLRALLQHEEDLGPAADGDYVLAAYELFPSMTVGLDKEHLRGIVTERGGNVSHAAILARSYGIPAVTGVEGIRCRLRAGDTVVMDGRTGKLFVNPEEKVLEKYRRAHSQLEALRNRLSGCVHEECRTTDGERVQLTINVERASDLNRLDVETIDGVGLFRTEFIFMEHGRFPSEEEQYEVYRGLAEKLGGRELVVRTLDIGDDKRLPYLQFPSESNPALGWRGLRVSFEWPDLFIVQIRALLRASVHGPLKILLPMVTTLEEVRHAKSLIASLKQDLTAQGLPFDADTPLGIMVEVPAVAWAIDDFLEEVDFVSVGTNDLVQYLMAVDRNNAKVSRLYQTFHPAVLNTMRHVLRACHLHQKDVTVCGEMGGNVASVLMLLGLGLRRFSVSPFYVVPVKSLIRSLSIQQAEEIVEKALTMRTGTEIAELFETEVLNIVSELEGYFGTVEMSSTPKV